MVACEALPTAKRRSITLLGDRSVASCEPRHLIPYPPPKAPAASFIEKTALGKTGPCVDSVGASCHVSQKSALRRVALSRAEADDEAFSVARDGGGHASEVRLDVGTTSGSGVTYINSNYHPRVVCMIEVSSSWLPAAIVPHAQQSIHLPPSTSTCCRRGLPPLHLFLCRLRSVLTRKNNHES